MERSPGATIDGLGSALHRSAVARTWGVLIVSALIFIILALRATAEGFGTTIVPMGVIAGIIVVEALLLRRFRAGDPNAVVPTRLVAFQTVFECSSPTIASGLNWFTGAAEVSILLTSPAVLVYTLFIMLAILHLRPWLTALAGLVCAVEHAGLVLSATATGSLADSSMSIGIFITYSVLLAIIGGTGAYVTARVRRYVESGIDEAERRTAAEGELEAASVVQQGLLPGEPPCLPGWSVAGWNRPAEQTGGDYWDWTQLPDGKVAVSIADVTGHGLGPAVVTAFCRAYARSAIHDSAGLALAIQRVARLLADDMPSGRFVTFAVALLTPDSGHVPLLSAGHGPTLLVRAADGHVDQFGADDLPLGVIADMAFDGIPELDLKPGDTLMMLTDGFFEWHNPQGKQWGLNRLAESAAKHRHLDPPQMIAALLADVEGFAQGTAQMDDLTAVVIRRSGH